MMKIFIVKWNLKNFDHLFVHILLYLCSGAFYHYYLYEWQRKSEVFLVETQTNIYTQNRNIYTNIYSNYKMSDAAILWFLCVLFLFLHLIDIELYIVAPLH